MPESFNLSLGGIPLALVPDRITGEYEAVKRAVEFRSSAAPEVTLQVHCGWFPELGDAPVVFETGHAWQLLHMGDQWVIKVGSHDLDPYQIGVFPPDFRAGEIYVARAPGDPERYIFPMSYPMGELFVMNLLGTGVGMLFHATGVIYQGKGYLFTGHGGAGKTTTARLWEKLPGALVVNDDKVIICQEADGFRLYGTPWHGEGGMAFPDSAPLSRVFILKQATQNYAAPIQPAQAAGMLLARTFSPLWDADKVAFHLKFLDDLCLAVPCMELGFLPESSAVDFVRNLPT